MLFTYYKAVVKRLNMRNYHHVRRNCSKRIMMYRQIFGGTQEYANYRRKLKGSLNRSFLGGNKPRHRSIHWQRVRGQKHSPESILAEANIFLSELLAIVKLIHPLRAEAMSHFLSQQVHLFNSDLIFSQDLVVTQVKIVRCGIVLQVVFV